MNLEEEEAALSKYLAGKVVRQVRRWRKGEVLVEFTDGSRLFVDVASDGLECSLSEPTDPRWVR